MIAEFIDGLQKFHFLQNALITAIVIGVVFFFQAEDGIRGTNS